MNNSYIEPSSLTHRFPKIYTTFCSFIPLLVAAAVVLWLSFSERTHAQISFGIAYVVDSTGDGDLVGPSTNCDDGTGHCTLRAAIDASNLHAGFDGISFDIPTSDPGYSNGVWTIRPAKALPDLSDSVNISGPGAAQLIVDAQLRFRVFNVTTGGTVSLSGITIANGGIQNFTQNQTGGAAIQNANGGTINITNCILHDNLTGGETDSSPAFGGAIYNVSNGTINVTSSTLRGNVAYNTGNPLEARGGGIFNASGTLHVSNSTFDHNRASNVGGGIDNEAAGTVTIISSTFFQNGADMLGGGISNFSGTLNITNSTFYANIAYTFNQGFGGAIYNFGTLNLTNSTVAGNFSNFGGSGVTNASSGVANVKSTIIAGNFGGTSLSGLPAPDVNGAFTSKGFNLIGRKDGSTGFSLGTDKKGTVTSPLDPKLDPKGLRSNGGSTQTIALMPGSPAIDSGTSAGLTGTLTKDQRGLKRTFDNTAVTNATGGDGTDIGAYERETQ